MSGWMSFTPNPEATTMLWFGKSWGAPVNESCAEGPTPVGAECSECGERINNGDRGFLLPLILEHTTFQVFHARCMMKMILGQTWPEIADLWGAE